MQGQKARAQVPKFLVPCLPPLFLQFNDHQLLLQPDLCGIFLKDR